MNETEIAELLKTFDARLAQTTSNNLKLAEEVKVQKSFSVLKDLSRYRIIELVIGIVIGLFLVNFLSANRESPNLVISAGILLFFTGIGIAGCVRELVLISQFDFAQSVTQNQATLISLQTHHINYLRLAILQFPFYLAYILIGFKILFGVEIWVTGNRNWLISNIILGFILFPVSIWLYRKIQIKNIHLKWVASIINLFGGKQLSKAMEFMDEIEIFKNE
jgi:hypothetical protein